MTVTSPEVITREMAARDARNGIARRHLDDGPNQADEC